VSWRRAAACSAIAALALAGCGRRSETHAEVPCRERAPESSDIEIAPPSEPGARLVVLGTVLRRGESEPLAGVTVYAYHADTRGNYARAGSNNPRLCGILRSDPHGSFRISTILPYGSAGEGAHIHFEVWGRGVSRQAATLYFANHSPSLFDTLSATARRSLGPGAVQGDLMRDSRGVYRSTAQLVVD